MNATANTSKKIARTIHGDGVIVSENYVLKTDVRGWMKAFRFADEDWYVKIPAGTVVTMIKHTDKTFSCFAEKTCGEWGYKIFEKNMVRFESDLLILDPYTKQKYVTNHSEKH